MPGRVPGLGASGGREESCRLSQIIYDFLHHFIADFEYLQIHLVSVPCLDQPRGVIAQGH
jgi:hypothetical protein